MTKENGSQVEVSFTDKQTSIFKKIISFAWANLASAIKETLSGLALAYIRSERIEGEFQKTRDNIAFHLYLLGSLVDDLRDVELNAPEIGDKRRLFYDRICSNCWDEHAYAISSTLNELSLVYICDERAANDPQDVRESWAFHLELLNKLVADLRDFQTEKTEDN